MVSLQLAGIYEQTSLPFAAPDGFRIATIKWRMINYWGGRIREPVCPNCDHPRHPNDSWGYAWSSGCPLS